MICTPDYKYLDAKKIVEELDEENEKEALTKYYIEKQESQIKEQELETIKYKNFFFKLNQFLPK